MVKSTCLNFKPLLLYSHRSMALALGYTKPACTIIQLNTTSLKECQKHYLLEILLSKWDTIPNKSFTLCGSPLFANICYPFHIGTKFTNMKKLNKSKLLKRYRSECLVDQAAKAAKMPSLGVPFRKMCRCNIFLDFEVSKGLFYVVDQILRFVSLGSFFNVSMESWHPGETFSKHVQM